MWFIEFEISYDYYPILQLLNYFLYLNYKVDSYKIIRILYDLDWISKILNINTAILENEEIKYIISNYLTWAFYWK